MSAQELVVPRTLPEVTSLSVSSIRTYLECPERWRRRYINAEWEPTAGRMLLGSAVHAAEGVSFTKKITTREDLPTSDVLDVYADEFDERSEREDVDWGEDKPAKLKDSGVQVVRAYHETIAPLVQPTSVERRVAFRLPGADWTFRGFIDLETDDGNPVDLKVTKRAMSAADIAENMQATAYLTARRLEQPDASVGREFEFHVLRTVKEPDATIVLTQRTEAQQDRFLELVVRVAREIVWRAEHDVWSGAAPGSWRCSERYCGFWPTCLVRP